MRVEVPLGVEVHVDVDPLADRMPLERMLDLVVEAGRPELAAAPGLGVDPKGGAAALLRDPVGADLEPGLAVQGQVGILSRPRSLRGSAGRQPSA